MKTVALVTLGCKLNQYETELIREHFEEAGYRVVPFTQPADVYVINTCTVTGRADRQSRNLVRKAARLSPSSRILTTGCYATVAPHELTALHPAVTAVDNANKIRYIQKLLNVKLEKIQRFSGHTRAFIKVVDGCERFCNYCIVPFARGRVQSRPLSSIGEEIQELVNIGYKEIILTGVNLGAYGLDLGESLLTLLRTLESVEGLRRLRLGSIEPEDVTDELIDAISNSDLLCRHLHIPLQSGDNGILKAMGRRYTCQDYARLVDKLTTTIPDVGLGTDVIVGFPGEKDGQFAHTCRMIEELPISYLHVFRYSPRRETKASSLPDEVSEERKRERSRALLDLGKKKSYQFRSRFLGRTLEVLVESRKDCRGLLTGLSANYVKVLFQGPDSLHDQFVDLEVARVTPSQTYAHRVRPD